ncbi:MAG: HAD-IA family hydrolase, partial [bacterium]
RYMYAYDDVGSALTELRAAGYRLGVVSNATAGMVNVLRVLGIERAVDFVIVSAIAGYEKPGQPIFEMAIQQSQCAPEEILFVGDHYICDYEASRKAGLNPLLINRAGRPQKEGVWQVRSLAELMPLLEDGFGGKEAPSG